MKEQIKTPEKELSKTKKNNLLEAEFKTLVMRMLNDLRGSGDGLREKFTSIKKATDIKKETVRNEGNTN